MKPQSSRANPLSRRSFRPNLPYVPDAPIQIGAYTLTGCKETRRGRGGKAHRILVTLANSLMLAAVRGEDIHLPHIGWLLVKRAPNGKAYYTLKPNPVLAARVGKLVKMPRWNIYETSDRITELEGLFLDRMEAGEDPGNILDVAETEAEALVDAICERGRVLKNWKSWLEAAKKQQEWLASRMKTVSAADSKLREILVNVWNVHGLKTIRDGNVTVYKQRIAPSLGIDKLDVPVDIPGTLTFEHRGTRYELPVTFASKIAGLGDIPADLLRVSIYIDVKKEEAMERIKSTGQDIPGLWPREDRETIVVR